MHSRGSPDNIYAIILRFIPNNKPRFFHVFIYVLAVKEIICLIKKYCKVVFFSKICQKYCEPIPSNSVIQAYKWLC